MKTALCILCRKPHKGNLLVASHVIQQGELDVIFIIDEPYIPPSDIDSRIKFIHIDDNTAIENGYKYSCKFVSFNHKDSVAWDKAFYYFGCCEHSYDFVWLIEDDVYIPSTKVLYDITNKYNQYDVVVGKIINDKTETYGNRWCFWDCVKPYMKGPYLAARVCSVGVSKKLFEVAATYVKENQRVPFIEGFIPSIAAQNNLKIAEAYEFYGMINCLHQPICHMPFHCQAYDQFTIDQFIMFSKNNPEIFLHAIKKEEEYCKILNELNFK